ncbi:uncharacterized protein LOC111051549 isoform X2 [Nilaparvata lugens]|uniref:uncharacterized protein LOC111051549 isoform X2 n=1 Tax=Nilaparvata lugens TaxID=108931 RepID=UPI00193D2BC8|nr:uncharacterized protein LOC111051549 isoform X2 [Nilaparvata lugens]
MAVPGNSVANSTVLFREVHKNAWLRRLPTDEKKIGAHSKKGERVWCVFCVHDDVEPFIEIYGDQKMAAAHKPDWCASLARALHVSPTICPQDQQFEFVVTLPDTALRLSAPSWEVMMEWVDSIGCKLREMHVLSPKENVYSRQPETRAPLTPLLPTRDPNSPLPLPPSVPPMLVPGVEALSLTTTTTTTTTTTSLTSTLYISNSQSDPDSPLTPSSQNITVIEVSANPIDYEPSTAETSSGLITSAHTLINREDHDDDDDDDDTVNDDDSLDEENIFDDDVAAVTCPPLPRLPSQLNRTNPSCDRSRNSHNNSNNSAQLTSQLIEVEAASVATTNQSHRSSRTTNASASDMEATAAPVPPASPALYEHVFLSSSRQPPTTSPPPPTSTTSAAAAAATPPPVDTNSASSSSPPPPLSADLRYSQVQQLYQNAVFCERVVPPVNAIRPRSGLRPNRRRSSDSSVPADRIRRLQAPPHPFRQPMAEAEGGVTLRERQVTQLRREMAHQGGVRLQLRRKDCLGSIALVDAFGAVWIAGWKQKEHPMLYNALHIGDKVISVAGVRVQNSCDAHKLIRGAPSLYVALVIRRVPCGRVLAVRREWEGQCVGVVQEGGTAEIKEVVAGGLAAQGGLPPRAPTHDGLSLTSWSLTEINGRPLNLFFKDNEVRDRLNAVGLDISFLVQPTDLVKQIRRQLKALRGYKDYIVQ